MKVKCESNFNELKKQNNELKNHINEINKHVENTHEIFKNNLNKLEQNIERMGVWVINTGKSKISENNGEICINSGSSLDAKQVTVDQVSSSDNDNELMSNDSDKIKNMVLECKVLSRESVDEGMSVCVESLEGQRADFPQVYCEMECSQWFYEDRVSSGGGVEDKVSSYGPLVFCGLPGSRGNRYLMVPFAWNGSCLLYTSRCV